jgi:hypothetical protein
MATKKTFVTKDFIYTFTYNPATCMLRVRDCKDLDTFMSLTGLDALVITSDRIGIKRLYAGCDTGKGYYDKPVMHVCDKFSESMLQELFEWLSDAIIMGPGKGIDCVN